MEPLTSKEWEVFENLLERVADMEKATWKEKQNEVKKNLTSRGLVALQEISAWEWE